MKNLVAFTAALIMVVFPALAQSSGDFNHVKGNVFFHKNGSYNSLVVATPEGTLVVDPLNSRAATRLRDNLSAITNQPVTHLVYSHSDGDHASGGTAFDDTATFVAHQDVPASMDGVSPDIRFEETHRIDLGGNTIELTYLGPGHGDGLIATIVRPENVAFIVDIAAPERMFFSNFAGANVDDWYTQITNAEALDFEIFVPGHGRVGSHADLTVSREYMEELREKVLAGLKQGKSAEQLVNELQFKDRSHWQQYDAWRGGNVSGMARFLERSGAVD